MNHLLNRTIYFFEHGNILNVTEWRNNMNTAMKRSTRKTKETASDISKYILITKPAPLPKNRLIAEFKREMIAKAKKIRNRLQTNIANLLISLKR